MKKLPIRANYRRDQTLTSYKFLSPSTLRNIDFEYVRVNFHIFELKSRPSHRE